MRNEQPLSFTKWLRNFLCAIVFFMAFGFFFALGLSDLYSRLDPTWNKTAEGPQSQAIKPNEDTAEETIQLLDLGPTLEVSDKDGTLEVKIHLQTVNLSLQFCRRCNHFEEIGKCSERFFVNGGPITLDGEESPYIDIGENKVLLNSE